MDGFFFQGNHCRLFNYDNRPVLLDLKIRLNDLYVFAVDQTVEVPIRSYDHQFQIGYDQKITSEGISSANPIYHNIHDYFLVTSFISGRR
jgi:hypothetical protein